MGQIGVFFPHRFAIEFESVRVVHQPVKDGIGES